VAKILRMLKAISELFKVDEPQKELDDIELMEDKFYLKNCRYISKDFEKKLSNVIHFHHDGLGFGECSIKYEYILTFRKFEDTKTFLMTTLTKFDENKINIADTISYIVINFNTYQDVISFEARLLSKILYYKDMDTFDKSIFKLKSFKKVIR
jgi:hypothetical protein